MEWLKLMWQKKKIYWSLLPHIFDQATDFGTIWAYYETYQTYQNDPDKDNWTFNPRWFVIFGLFIIIFQRFMSMTVIYFMTNNHKAALLQFVDLLMIKAIWVNYDLGLTEPCNPQRYIGILVKYFLNTNSFCIYCVSVNLFLFVYINNEKKKKEATFESAPQVVLSMGFILKSNHKIEPIIIISTIFSLWSLTSKVAADDKMIIQKREWKNFELKMKKKAPFIFFNWQYLVRVILWRFLEISSRICLIVMLWINLGGLATTIIIGVEVLTCIIWCIAEKTYVHLSPLSIYIPH